MAGLELEIEKADVDVFSMESFAADLISERCLEAGAPTTARRRETADGEEQTLGSLVLDRAPSALPATGLVDPLTTSMEGAWTILPTGGLRRRSGSCPEPE